MKKSRANVPLSEAPEIFLRLRVHEKIRNKAALTQAKVVPALALSPALILL
jgi:hypothetical protein